jgi:hypothetical protein
MTKKTSGVDSNNNGVTLDETYFDPKKSPVVTVVLHSEELAELTPAEKKYPEARQQIILDRYKNDLEQRIVMNEATRSDLQRYADRGVIEIIEETEDSKGKKPADAVEVKTSEMKPSDFTARGLPVPQAVRDQQS